jgi:predicted dehydrogenase
MDKIQFAIVGCGGMGGRHLRGVQELYGSSLCNMELVACCDLRRDNAEYLAGEAEKRLGKRPRVFTDMETMTREMPDLRAVDITTSSGSHHAVASQALKLGLNVLVEKPLAVSVRGCNLVIDVHSKYPNQVLSVAEQFRRDPICRLMKALLDAGVIGQPYAFFSIGAGSSNKIIIFPWRHDKNIGGILTDAGVHTVDLMQYWMGPIREIYARTRLCEPIRYKSTSVSDVSPFYEHWGPEIPDQMQATAEDTLISVFSFESGVLGQWTSFNAAHGEGFGRTVAYGSKGSLRSEGARNGRPLSLRLDDKGDITGQAILDLVPDFHLDAITANLFGGDRMASYPYVFAEADRKLVAVEYYELGQCIMTGKKPEVDGPTGRSTLAVCHAALESGVLNRPVTVAEIIAEETAEYEKDVNAYWRI